MKMKWVHALIVGTFLSVETACADPVALTSNDYGKPGGVAQLTTTGSINYPLTGTADAATVGGAPLSYIIPALQAQGRLGGSYISVTNLNQPSGVPQLDGHAWLTTPVVGPVTTSLLEGTGNGPTGQYNFTQGYALGYNQQTGSQDETDFINIVGTGTGGFTWYNTALSGWTSTAQGSRPTPLMTLSAAGVLHVKSIVTDDGSGGSSNSGGGSSTVAGVTHRAGLTYASLPASPTSGDEVYCSDCYSLLRSGDYTGLGIVIHYDGTAWVDAVGTLAQH